VQFKIGKKLLGDDSFEQFRSGLKSFDTLNAMASVFWDLTTTLSIHFDMKIYEVLKLLFFYRYRARFMIRLYNLLFLPSEH